MPRQARTGIVGEVTSWFDPDEPEDSNADTRSETNRDERPERDEGDDPPQPRSDHPDMGTGDGDPPDEPPPRDSDSDREWSDDGIETDDDYTPSTESEDADSESEDTEATSAGLPTAAAIWDWMDSAETLAAHMDLMQAEWNDVVTSLHILRGDERAQRRCIKDLTKQMTNVCETQEFQPADMMNLALDLRQECVEGRRLTAELKAENTTLQMANQAAAAELSTLQKAYQAMKRDGRRLRQDPDTDVQPLEETSDPKVQRESTPANDDPPPEAERYEDDQADVSNITRAYSGETPTQGGLIPEINIGGDGAQEGEITLAANPTPSEAGDIHLNANRTIPVVQGVSAGKAKEIKAMTGMFTPGRKSDLPQWMEKFEWACETAGLSDDQKASVIGALLGEGAFRVYRDIPDDQRCDWTAIKDTLLRIYPKTKPSLHQSRAKWDSLPLKTFTTFEKLAGKIQQYAHLAHPGFPQEDLEEEKRSMFTKCLPSREIRALLIAKGDNITFADMVAEASRINTEIRVCDRFSPGPKNKEDSDTHPLSTSDEEDGTAMDKLQVKASSVDDRTPTPSQDNNVTGTNLSDIVEQLAHVYESINAGVKKADPGWNTRQNNVPNDTRGSPRWQSNPTGQLRKTFICYDCREPGHFATRCPLRPEKERRGQQQNPNWSLRRQEPPRGTQEYQGNSYQK